jgi:serine/threonine protein kinase
MQQLLCGLDHCHNRGVLHRDIKGANLLLDNNGILKIADFGLATFFNPKQKQHLTSRVVTLWYRPPELLLGATNYGAAVDLWSAGCILAELLSGKPIMPGRTEVLFGYFCCDKTCTWLHYRNNAVFSVCNNPNNAIIFLQICHFCYYTIC